MVVDHLDVSVAPGTTFGFLGPNGAGKSTTIRMMLGLVRPTSGEATLFGHSVARHRLKALEKVGALVETPSFYPYLTGRENLSLFASLSGRVGAQRLDEVLRLVGLAERAGDRVKTYSHGMKQRLGIACALMPDPDLIILDEPTNGLDPVGVKDVRELIGSLASEYGKTVFLSSHLLHEVEQVCTHVGVLNRGKLIAHGGVEQLLGGADSIVELELSDVEAARRVHVSMFDGEPLWVDGSRVGVRLGREQTAEYNRGLVREGVNVWAMNRRAPSLEDYYIELVRDKGRVC